MKNTNKVLNFQNYFASLVLMVGLLFAVLIPPGEVPDEINHFIRIQQFITGDVNSLVQIPQNPFVFQKNNSEVESYQDLSLKNLINSLIKRDAIIPSIHKQGTSSRYHIINYLPSLIGLLIGKILRLNIFSQFVLGRITNLFAYIIAGFWILKTTPVDKKIVFVLLTLPMSIFLAASYSADNVLIILTYIFLNLLLINFKSANRFSKKKWSFFLSLTILLSLTKPVSILFLITLFSIPVTWFGNKKKKYLLIISTLFLGLITTIIWNIQALNTLGTFSLLQNINPKKQLAYILLNPLDFLVILKNTFTELGSFYFQSFMGNFGGLNIPLPDFSTFILLITIILSILWNSKNEIYFSKEQKWIFAFVFCLYILSFEVIMFLLWTPFGERVIQGVQGRYFIPIIPLFIFLFIKPRTCLFPYHRLLSFFILISTPFVLAISLHVNYLHYYSQCGENFYNINQTCKLPKGLYAEKSIGEILEPTKQTFTALCDDINSIELFFGTYQRQNTGSLMVSLYNLTSKSLVFDKKIDVSNLKDNVWESLNFPPIHKTYGQEFEITVIPYGSSPGNAVTIWATEFDNYSQGKLLGFDSEIDLVFRYGCPYDLIQNIQNYINKN